VATPIDEAIALGEAEVEHRVRNPSASSFADINLD
jgi:hypothetical protein